VPAVRSADFESESASGAEFVLECCGTQFGREILRVAKVGEGFKAVTSSWIAGNEIRLGPVGNEDGAGESSGVSGVLENLDLRAGVGEEVGDHGGDALVFRGAEFGMKKICERDDVAFLRQSGAQDGFGFFADLDPGLEQPGLRGGGFSGAQKRGETARLPGIAAFLVGQMVFRYVKKCGHACGPRK